MNHKGTKTIETERLILRKFTRDDISFAYKNWTSDEAVTKYLRWPTHKDISVTERVINEWIASYENPAYYQWAIELASMTSPEKMEELEKILTEINRELMQISKEILEKPDHELAELTRHDSR